MTAVLVSVLFSSCSAGAEITVISWNLQTFFDAENDGSEYPEFLKSRQWGKEMYVRRLERLASVIKSRKADVFVMEELESEAVLFDIYNALAGQWNLRDEWKYCCFARTPGSSIGCGILSKIPLGKPALHSVEIRGRAEKKLRPIMEVTLTKGRESFVLFVNHWKSMSGGKDETEFYRRKEEALLARRMNEVRERGILAVACGDFNRDVMDFYGAGNGKVFLRSDDSSNENLLEVCSPWFEREGTLVQPGSYYFRDEWSRIDNFFLSDGRYLKKFTPLCGGEWCSESGVPYSFRLGSGDGFSDHLPVKLTVDFSRN